MTEYTTIMNLKVQTLTSVQQNQLTKPPFLSALEDKIDNNLLEGNNSIPIIKGMSLKDITYEFGDKEVIKNINTNNDINKIEWLQNCKDHINVVENTQIVLKQSSEREITFVKEILEKVSNKEILDEVELYKNLGNLVTYTCLNADLQTLNELAEVFWKSYSTLETEQILKQNMELTMICNDTIEKDLIKVSNNVDNNLIKACNNIDNNLIEVSNNIDKTCDENIEKNRALTSYNRKKALFAVGCFFGTAVLAKIGVPMLPIIAAKQYFSYVPTSTVEDAPRVRDVFDQAIKNCLKWLRN